jgi:hypothetical protein
MMYLACKHCHALDRRLSRNKRDLGPDRLPNTLSRCPSCLASEEYPGARRPAVDRFALATGEMEGQAASKLRALSHRRAAVVHPHQVQDSQKKAERAVPVRSSRRLTDKEP